MCSLPTTFNHHIVLQNLGNYESNRTDTVHTHNNRQNLLVACYNHNHNHILVSSLKTIHYRHLQYLSINSSSSSVVVALQTSN